MSDEKPLVSIIIPVYNIESYVDDCLSSVTEQTYANIEIILVNDKSTDRSGRLCDSWAKKNNRINVIHKSRNEGLNMARHSGWRASSGELIAFVDGDDFIDQRYIEALYEAISASDADISACGYRFFEYNKSPLLYRGDTLERKTLGRLDALKYHAAQQHYIPDFRGNLTTVHCKLFKRGVVESVNWKKSNFSIGEDDFFSLMCISACKSMTLIYDELYYYRVSPNSISRSKEFSVKYNQKSISVFELIRLYRDLSSNLLGEKLFNETYFRVYGLYQYYIQLMISKGVWTDSDFHELDKHMSTDIDNILRVEGYEIDQLLLSSVKKDGVIKIFTKIIVDTQQELRDLYTHKDAVYADLVQHKRVVRDRDEAIRSLREELNSYLSVKRSMKLLAGNIKRKVSKSKA